MNELSIVNDKHLRERCCERTEVLDKVKTLVLMPQLEMMTLKQIADYYEVDLEVVRKCYLRNKEEIDLDGAAKIPVKSMVSRLGQNVPIVSTKGYKVFKLDENTELRVPNVGITLFPKRAILRIGMLLRDSEVAKEVRTQLLNILENSTDEEKTVELDKEMDMIQDIAKAFAAHDMTSMMCNMQTLYSYQRRHIEALTAENKDIRKDKDMLTAEILRWDDRQSVNKAIRSIAQLVHKPVGVVWGMLYSELRYKYGMGLSQRGKSPYIQHVRDDEWPNVQKSLSAICEELGVSASKVLERCHMDSDVGDKA